MFFPFLLTFSLAETWFSLFLVKLSFLHIAVYDLLEWSCCIDAIWSMRKMLLTLTSFSLHHFITVARRMERWSEMFLKYFELFIYLFSSIECCKSNSNELNRNADKAAHTAHHIFYYDFSKGTVHCRIGLNTCVSLEMNFLCVPVRRMVSKSF